MPQATFGSLDFDRLAQPGFCFVRLSYLCQRPPKSIQRQRAVSLVYLTLFLFREEEIEIQLGSVSRASGAVEHRSESFCIPGGVQRLSKMYSLVGEHERQLR